MPVSELISSDRARLSSVPSLNTSSSATIPSTRHRAHVVSLWRNIIVQLGQRRQPDRSMVQDRYQVLKINRSPPGSGICYNFHQLDTDPFGNHLMAGCFTNNVTLSPNVTLNGTSVGNTYLAKYDSKGELLWSTYISSLTSKYYTIVRTKLSSLSVGLNSCRHCVRTSMATSTLLGTTLVYCNLMAL